MAKKRKSAGPAKRRVSPVKAEPERSPASVGDRVTYRELRNTPGRVWERLSDGRPMTLVAEGEAKAIVIPVRGGDVEGALEAYRRGRAMMALSRIQAAARASGKSKMTLAEINRVIREVRRERLAREAGE